MREFLFRGKRLDNGQWVEGHLVVCKTNGRSFITELIEVNEDSWLYWEVDPNTVDQYTGLTDKNGNKIFEGDIIALNPRRFANKKVFYYTRCAGFYMTSNPDIPKTCEITAIFNDDSDKYEVIGNIYDNPELTKI